MERSVLRLLRRKKHGILLALALLVNFVFLGRLVYNWTLTSATAIPHGLITENKLVLAELAKVGAGEDRKIVVALMSSAAGVCTSDSIVRIFKKVQLKSPDAKLLLLVSHSVSDNEISVFKENAGVAFEVDRMNTGLDSFFEGVSRQYYLPGILILQNHDLLVASQDKEEINRILDSFEW